MAELTSTGGDEFPAWWSERNNKQAARLLKAVNRGQWVKFSRRHYRMSAVIIRGRREPSSGFCSNRMCGRKTLRPP